MKIVPITRHNLTDEVIKQIKKVIIDGNLKPGDKLPPERELAEKFHVGRTTIREALKALNYTKIIIRTREGTIVNRNMLDYFIDSLSKKLIYKYIGFKDLLEARKVLEIKLVSLASQRATIEDIKTIGNIFKKMNIEIKSNPRKFITSDIKFHESIAEAAQNRVLYEIFIAVRSLIRKSQEELVKDPGIMKCSLEYHRQIFEAIKKQNASEAEIAMYNHLDNIEKTLMRLEESELKKY